ncbi:MAG TPA: anthranilate synthase component I [Mycobacteriales bacterium]
MTTGQAVPDRAGFARLARGSRLVPVTRRLLADGETPVGVYRKLAGGRPGTFLLESAEHGRSWSRWSFVGVRCSATLSERDGRAVWTGTPPPAAPADGDPLEVLAATWRALLGPAPADELPDLPPLTGGLVGYLGYDVVRRIERLPAYATDDLGLPELTMLVATDVAVVDHYEASVLLVANALVPPDAPAAAVDAAYEDAVARLDAMTRDLATPAPPSVAVTRPVPPAEHVSRTPPGQYQPAVKAALDAVRAGEVFQVQIGQRFETRTDADALDIYRVLRTLNPSPYMYLLRLDGFDIVGSSPEALVTVTGGRAVLHPIAGTRKRGDTPERDAELAAELVSDVKERAEHVMLVDLARNDLGRVCAPGTVRVVEFGALERYSHVWHIVSTVTGEVAPGRDALDVLTACFPAGTLTGAPKVRAMEIIDELEPVRRGVYGGAVGYLDAAGDLDMAIAIRTAVVRDGTAYVQASAGIVADSLPAAEELETRNKARAVLQALATAATLTPPAIP